MDPKIPEKKYISPLSDPGFIDQHISNLVIHKEPISHDMILEKILEKIDEIDFRQVAGLSEDDKIKNNHLLIIVVEQLLKLAKENSWGLCINTGFVYLYNKAYWKLIEKEEVQSFLGLAAEKMGIDHYKASYYQFRDQLLKQFNALANLPRPESKNDKVLINLQNGTYEISNKITVLRNFRAEDFLTYQLPFDFNPKAESPLFNKFLDDVLPDKDRQNVLAEYLGSIFINNQTLKLEKSLLLYGTGGNGKSVVFDILNAIIGEENFSSFSLNCLTDQSGYYRAKIGNKLVNYASEIDGKMNVGIFKQLVSGEPVEARLPYGDPMIIKEYAKLILENITVDFVRE
jgi:putative DNA primase/helicase